jgi:hypothetical protein
VSPTTDGMSHQWVVDGIAQGEDGICEPSRAEPSRAEAVPMTVAGDSSGVTRPGCTSAPTPA